MGIDYKENLKISMQSKEAIGKLIKSINEFYKEYVAEGEKPNYEDPMSLCGKVKKLENELGKANAGFITMIKFYKEKTETSSQ